jgi:Ca-activated chloride channel family protein
MSGQEFTSMRRLTLLGIFLAAAGAAFSARALLAQTTAQPPQQPTFRGVTRVVPVWATVRDGSGAFQLDLTKDDFEIRDNGKVQTIDQFTREVQPLSVVVVIDGSSSMMPVFQEVLDGVNQFVIRLMPGDEGRVASFADETRMSPAFTTNRDDLLDYLRDQFNIRMANTTRLWDGLADAVYAVGQRKGKRRVVVVFTDGDDTSSATSEGHVASMAADRDTIIYALAMWNGQPGGRPNPRIESLATGTGGGFYELHATDDMNSTFTGIAEELHNQYVLGFSPAALDGKEHKLEVKVKRPNMLVRSRKAYVASPDSAGGIH